MIETSLRLLDQLAGIQNIPEGYAWVRSLLLISCASKFPDELALEQVKGLALPGTEPLSAPVVIVTGGCDASIEQKMRGYRDFLIEAFRDFNGTILSGGTTAGISGPDWEGGTDLSRRYPNHWVCSRSWSLPV